MRRFDNVPICDSCLMWKYGSVPVYESDSPCVFCGNHPGASNKTVRVAIHDAGARESQAEAVAKSLTSQLPPPPQNASVVDEEECGCRVLEFHVAGPPSYSLQRCSWHNREAEVQTEAVKRLVEAVKNHLGSYRNLWSVVEQELWDALAALEKPEVKP